MVRKTTKKVIKKRTKKVQKGKGIIDTAKALLFGRTKLPPQVRKILEKYGDKEIDYIQVARNPLATTTKMALDAVSFGSFSKRAKKLPYDELYHLYIVFAKKRDALLKYCLSRGIEAKVHYPEPIYRQEALNFLGHKKGDFPVSDYHTRNIITFPCDQHKTKKELDYVIKTVKRFYNK